MSDGWKLATLARRRQFLAEELDRGRANGLPLKAMKWDQREYDALDWAIPILNKEVEP
jgi:hypothetical protein